jgi:CubicO group peptidase (beta-lactamase class C family)
MTAARLSTLCLALAIPLFPAHAESPPKNLAAVLQPFVDSHSLAGAVVLVANKDKVLDLEAVGYLDVAAKKPMPTDAIFWIASQSKPITGAALMILADEGKVKLDDPVEKYIPEFANVKVAVKQEKGPTTLRKPKRSITVRDILNHTSGMPFASAKERPTLDGLTLKEGVKSYAETPLQSEPGEKWSYSNAGINTAGRIIEVVSGTSYEAFLDKRLFGPLGMKDTTFWPSKEQQKRLAKSYKPDAAKKGLEETTVGQLKYPLDDRKRQPMPAGGLFSSANDVARFCQMVLNGGTFEGKRYLSAEAVKQMTSDQTGALKRGYGLGWSTGGHVGHGGAFATNMAIDAKRGLVLVWMVQHAGYPGDGGKAQGAFVRAAEGLYGEKK